MMGDLDLASSGSTVGVPKANRDCHRAPIPGSFTPRMDTQACASVCCLPLL